VPKKASNGNDRARTMLAQEAARIIVEQGIQDYRLAKTKAAERLGMSARGSLPGNPEIEHAVGEHLKLFGRESHLDLLRILREAALSAMELLAAFTPRLVGPVLHGTAAANSAVNLHHAKTFSGFRFTHDNSSIEATVFPVDGMRQAPISPVNGKPMQRADRKAVLGLLDP